CRNPFPSRPLGFYGERGAERFHEAYFSQHEGMWTHGDWIESRPHGGMRVHGRSDGVLNIRGVRIGPAEIYAITEGIDVIRAQVAVEEQDPDEPGASRMVLLVVLREGEHLDSALRARIMREIASRTTSAHVPAVIAQVSDLPTTYSGKRSERAAA